MERTTIDWRSSTLFYLLYVFAFGSFILNTGCQADGLNNTYSDVALLRPTSQSPELDNSSYLSNLAVDGNITTCSRTAEAKGANWTVDLEEILPISQVKINTGGISFGQNFEVYFNSFVPTPYGGMMCFYGTTDSAEREYVRSCFDGPAVARYITIKNRYSSGVTLCDVQVLVCHNGFFGVGCTKECHCDKGDLCNKVNGKCPDLCAPGWNGTDCQSGCANSTFGASCQHTCHCVGKTFCDSQTGNCPAGCADGWVGPSCRTEIPRLNTAPTMYSTDTTHMRITWFSWRRFVDPSITLVYQVEYRLIEINTTHPWVNGPRINDSALFNEDVVVQGLHRNSFYSFRIIPILKMDDETEVQGFVSPESVAYRTKCTVPVTPNVTRASSWIDTNRNTPIPVLFVEWTPLTKEQSNCENILYYEVYYQQRAPLGMWKKTGAKKTESAKNITSEISFNTEYVVRVAAHNNHPYDSISDIHHVQTPDAPEIPHSTQAIPTIAIIIAGVIVCCGVIVAVILAFIVYKQKTKKKKVPTATLR